MFPYLGRESDDQGYLAEQYIGVNGSFARWQVGTSINDVCVLCSFKMYSEKAYSILKDKRRFCSDVA